MTTAAGVVAGRPSANLVGVSLALVAAAGFASGPIWAVQAYDTGLDWLGVLMWRFIVASVVTWAIVLVTTADRRELRALERREIVLLAGLGVMYIANASTYYIAVERIAASTAVLISHSSLAMIAVLSLRFGRPLNGRRAWLGLVLAGTGVAIVVGAPSGTQDGVGLAFAFGSAALHATWALLAARRAGERRDGAVQGTGSGAAVAIMFLASSCGLVLLALIRGSGPLIPSIGPGSAWQFLLPFGIISALGIRAWYAATGRIGVARVSIISTSEPAMTIGLAVLVLSESFTVVQAMGAVAILLGVLLVRPSEPDPAPDVQLATRDGQVAPLPR